MGKHRIYALRLRLRQDHVTVESLSKSPRGTTFISGACGGTTKGLEPAERKTLIAELIQGVMTSD